jgi:hypothetical protein
MEKITKEELSELECLYMKGGEDLAGTTNSLCINGTCTTFNGCQITQLFCKSI